MIYLSGDSRNYIHYPNSKDSSRSGVFFQDISWGEGRHILPFSRWYGRVSTNISSNELKFSSRREMLTYLTDLCDANVPKDPRSHYISLHEVSTWCDFTKQVYDRDKLFTQCFCPFTSDGSR